MGKKRKKRILSWVDETCVTSEFVTSLKWMRMIFLLTALGSLTHPLNLGLVIR